MSDSRQTWKVLFLGVPLLVLVFAGMTVTAFLSVNLIVQGARDGLIGDFLLGSLIGSLWLLMLVKTVRARRAEATPSGSR